MSEYHQQKLIENITQNITKVISELINSIKEEQKKVIEHPHFKSYSSIRPDCTKIHELRNIIPSLFIVILCEPLTIYTLLICKIYNTKTNIL